MGKYVQYLGMKSRICRYKYTRLLQSNSGDEFTDDNKLLLRTYNHLFVSSEASSYY